MRRPNDVPARSHIRNDFLAETMFRRGLVFFLASVERSRAHPARMPRKDARRSLCGETLNARLGRRSMTPQDAVTAKKPAAGTKTLPYTGREYLDSLDD